MIDNITKKWKKENRNISIMVNFGDSDFYIYIQEIAEKYCERYNKTVSYWDKIPQKDNGQKVHNKFTDIEYIRNFFSNMFVGYYLADIERDTELEEKDFKYAKELAKNVFNDIHVISIKEYDDGEPYYNEALLLSTEIDRGFMSYKF